MSLNRLGIVAGTGISLLGAVYAVALTAGLLSLPSQQQPVGGALFVFLELLILLIAPLMVMLMAAVHALAAPAAKAWSNAALGFMMLAAVLTFGVHAATLAAGSPQSFVWPSLPYALDILAWDAFFALSVLCAAPVFRGGGLEGWIRRLLAVSGILALAGLSGVVTGEMRLRNIGIAGYAVLFPVAAALMAALFARAQKRAR